MYATLSYLLLAVSLSSADGMKDIVCVDGERACLLRSVFTHGKTVSFQACSPPMVGLSAFVPVVFSVKGPLYLPSTFNLVANESCDSSYVGGPHYPVHVIFEPFYMPNVGHAMGDDIFPIFRALRLFGFHAHPRITVLTVQPLSSYPSRVLEMYELLHLRVQDYEDDWYPNMITGIAGLSYHEPLPFGTGGVLDDFRDWVYARARITTNDLHQPVFTLIGKDYDVAGHPNGMANPAAVEQWIKNMYPQSTVRHIMLTKVSFAQQLNIFHSTDVLIGAPGSDLMTAIFLKNKRVLLIIPEVFKLVGQNGTCDLSLGHEYDGWFQHRGSVQMVTYPVVYPNETVKQIQRGDGPEFWYRVVVDELRFADALRVAVNALN